jgi:RNA polymerase sigma-70 factor (ECF subfamily)
VQEPEPETIRQAQRGDHAAFEELVRLYLPDVYRLARHIARNEQMAEDITQDTFLNAYRGIRRFGWRSKFSTWLFRIAHNCAVDAVRRASRQLIRPFAADDPLAFDPALRLTLRAAVDDLPDDLRRAFTLVEVFGFSYTEAMTILGWPRGTLKSRMHRARRLLSAALTDTEDTGEV